MTDQTSIFEMREIVDGSEFQVPVETLITSDAVDRHPHRDYDKLKAATERHDLAKDICEDLGCHQPAAKQWARAYDLDGYPHQEQTRLAGQLSQMDPGEVSG